jgi:RimJ/RimL family protein N-acetyltransferase
MIVIREAMAEDAAAILEYVEGVSGESDYLTFGPGEFEHSLAEEEQFLRSSHESYNQIMLLGLLDGEIVSVLSFSAGRRPRVRHFGEFGISVRKTHWGLGIGAQMIDALIAWAKDTGVIKKINLRVRTDNEKAIALYERKGFAIEGTIRRAIYMDGRYYDNYWMGSEL